MGVIVHCKLENASENISGVDFSRHAEGHMATAEIEAEIAERFAGIGGYEIADANPTPPDAAERMALLGEGEALGLKLDGRWKTDKLRDAVAAEKARRETPPTPPEGEGQA